MCFLKELLGRLSRKSTYVGIFEGTSAYLSLVRTCVCVIVEKKFLRVLVLLAIVEVVRWRGGVESRPFRRSTVRLAKAKGSIN